MTKTAIKLNFARSIWPMVEKWATEHNYQLETPGENPRLYVRKSADSSARINVTVSQIDTDVSINAWFSDAIRAELEIDAPSLYAGLYAALPRKRALAEIQNLLAKLGYTPPDKTKKKDGQNFAFNLGRSVRKLSGKK
jgi:hypothetical protein